MEAKNEQELFEEESINLEELSLGGEVLNIQLDYMTPGQFEKTLVEAPEGITLQKDRYLKVIEGFTPGAVKNIITIARHKIRVYAVTGTKIEFTSSSGLHKEASELIFEESFKSGSVIAFRKKATTIQLLSGSDFRSLALKLHPETAVVVDCRVSILSEIEQKFQQKSSTAALPFPKNSKKEFYIGKLLSSGAFYQIIGSQKARKWVDFTDFLQNKIKRESFRYVLQRSDRLPRNLWPNFPASGDLRWQNDIFKSKSQGESLICSRNRTVLHLALINFKRRKVLFSRSINLLDVLSNSAVESLLRMRIEGQDQQEELGGGQNPWGFNTMLFELKKLFFQPKSDSLVVDIRVENKETILNLEKIFWSRDLIGNSKAVSFINKDSDVSLIGPGFSEDSILSFKPKGTEDPSHQRSLVWLGSGDLKQKAVKGFEDDAILNQIYRRCYEEISYLPLLDGKMLVLNSFSAMIYDYDKGEIAGYLDHTFDFDSKIGAKRVEDLVVFGTLKSHVHLLKIENLGERSIRASKARTIFFDEVLNFSGESPKENQEFPLWFKLENGNYLMVSKAVVPANEEGLGEENGAGTEQVTIEVKGDTLEILKVERKNNTGKIDTRFAGSSVHLVSGFLVFAGRDPHSELPDTNGSEMTCLTLASLGFEILDQSREAPLSRNNSIRMITCNKIISTGLNCSVNLHEVDAKNKKLVLLKKLKLVNSSQIDSFVSFQANPYLFSCLVKTQLSKESRELSQLRQNKEAYLLLNFDSDLKLVSHTEHNGLFGWCEWCCPLPGQKIFGCIRSDRHPYPHHFLVDLAKLQAFSCGSPKSPWFFSGSSHQKGESVLTKIEGDEIVMLRVTNNLR